MKELSIEQKAKRYDEVHEKLRSLHDDYDTVSTLIDVKKELEEILPELKESEDERIREALIKYFTLSDDNADYQCCGVHCKDIVAWLEKQGDHSDFLSKIQVGDKVTRNEDGVLVNLSQLNRVAKPADKVEPKFHEGDWVVENEPNNYARFIQILETVNVQGKERYRISRDIHNDEDVVEFGFVEKYYHKFDVKDAKEGDVLACPNDAGDRDVVFIFKNINSDEGWVFCFCASDANGCFCTNNDYVGNSNSTNISPATKEQRNALFAKMKNAGYEWNAEKRELKIVDSVLNILNKDHREVQQEDLIKKPSLINVGGNEMILSDVISILDNGFMPSSMERARLVKGLQSIKLQQNSSAWSEEDEKMINTSVSNLTELMHRYREKYGNVGKCIDWLKSLKDRYTWKPSDEQMNALKHASNDCSIAFADMKILATLYEQLKALHRYEQDT